jgi:hypothetical protein
MRWLPSPSTRSEASESKATKRPVALIAGRTLEEAGSPPMESTLTRSVPPRSTVKPILAAHRCARMRHLPGSRTPTRS